MVTAEEREELIKVLQAVANHVRTRELHQVDPEVDALWDRIQVLYRQWRYGEVPTVAIPLMPAPAPAEQPAQPAPALTGGLLGGITGGALGGL